MSALIAAADPVLAVTVQAGGIGMPVLLRCLAELSVRDIVCPRLLDQAVWQITPEVVRALQDTALGALSLAFSAGSADAHNGVRLAAFEAWRRAKADSVGPDALIVVLTGVSRAKLCATSLFEDAAPLLTHHLRTACAVASAAGARRPSGPGEFFDVFLALRQLTALVRAYSLQSVVVEALVDACTARLGGLLSRTFAAIAAEIYIPASQRVDIVFAAVVVAYHLILMRALPRAPIVFIDVLTAARVLCGDGNRARVESQRRLNKGPLGFSPLLDIDAFIGPQPMKTSLHLIHLSLLARCVELKVAQAASAGGDLAATATWNVASTATRDVPSPVASAVLSPDEEGLLLSHGALLPQGFARDLSASIENGDTRTSRLQCDLTESLRVICAAAGHPRPSMEYRTDSGLIIDIALAVEAPPSHGGARAHSLPTCSSANFSAEAVVHSAVAASLSRQPAGIAIELNGPYHYTFDALSPALGGSKGDGGGGDPSQSADIRWTPLHGSADAISLQARREREALTRFRACFTQPPCTPPPRPLQANLGSTFREWLLRTLGWAVLSVPMTDFDHLHDRSHFVRAAYLARLLRDAAPRIAAAATSSGDRARAESRGRGTGRRSAPRR